ncbi:septum formation protein Maf [bacterium]|nr:septum formation protein Maf [bacterium]
MSFVLQKKTGLEKFCDTFTIASMKIILASTSPTRREIFKKLGIVFEVVAPDCDEILIPSEKMETQVSRFAAEKSKSVYKKFEQEKNILVIGFDSLVEVDGEILGKAKTKKIALEMFQKYRGKKVGGFTGISLVGNFNGKFFERTEVEKSWIHFRSDTTNCQIRDFLEFGDWRGKAGAITVEGPGAFFVEKFEGDFQNILGVPVLKMGEMIREIFKKNPIKLFTPKK